MVVFEHLSDTLSANFDLLVTQAVWQNPHFWGAFGPLSILRNGALAVGVFFALSGFVLTHALYKSSNLLGKDFLIFMIKRYVRFALPVFALHVLVLALFNLGMVGVGPKLGIAANGFSWLLHPQLSLNLVSTIYHAFISTTFLGSSFFNPVLWTISVEMYGSLVVLLLLTCWKNKFPQKIRIVLSILILATALFVLHKTFFVGFIAGALTYILTMRIKPRFLYRSTTKWALAVLTLFLAFHSAKGGDTNPFNVLPLPMHSLLHYVYYSLAGCSLITILIVSTRPNGVLTAKPLQYLGQRSFSLYLVHYLVIQTVGLDIRDYLTSTTVLGLAEYLMILVGLSILASELFYRFVESPCLTLLRQVKFSQPGRNKVIQTESKLLV